MVPPPDPNVDPDDKGNGGDPKFVTQEQLSQVVNAAVSNHMKRLDGKLSTTITDAVAAALKANTPDPPDDPPKDIDDPKAKANPEATALKRQVAQLETKLNKAVEEASDERTQRRSAGLKTAVMKHLGEAGLSGAHLKGASAVLYQDQRVRVTDDGDHLFIEADGVEVPLADGVKEWSASDDAKLFRKPVDVRGSGDGPHDQTKLPKLPSDEMSQAYADSVSGVEKHLMNQT